MRIRKHIIRNLFSLLVLALLLTYMVQIVVVGGRMAHRGEGPMLVEPVCGDKL